MDMEVGVPSAVCSEVTWPVPNAISAGEALFVPMHREPRLGWRRRLALPGARRDGSVLGRQVPRNEGQAQRQNFTT
jgi:hypothetical protein